MNPGTVYLVGAGPGDPELVTLKARRLIAQADAIFYDELANPAILDWAPADCERIYAGKRDHCHSLPQASLHQLLIARAQRGGTIIRLKGGDPFLFGRGGEEAAALAAAGIPWQLVPGISAGLAAPALAGIPLTQRGVAAQVRFRSGHACGGPRRDRGTEVVFMAQRRLAAVAAELVAEGWSPDTPAALIARASWPDQQVLCAPLAEIAARAEAAALPSPALLAVGEVVAWAQAVKTVTSASPPAVSPQPPAGIVVLAHGSPLPAWHASVERLVADLGASWARAAYLPPAQPGLGAVAGEAAAAGLRKLAVVPYFLADGLHVTRDIPALVAAAQAAYPELEIELTASLEGHPALRTAVWARVTEAAQQVPEPAPALPQFA
ncbi:MAG: uroporphyrinogen-III C-methyltransferase [Terriglobales bacterium]